MTKLFTFLSLLTFVSFAQASDTGTFPGIEKLMNADEFSAAGLDKLGPEERQALDEWLIRYTAWQAPEIRQTNKEVKEAEKAYELIANVKQPFKGWSGKTYFYLDNGQVWQQRSKGRYYYSGEDTSIRVSKNLFGLHVMELIATGREIGIKRIK